MSVAKMDGKNLDDLAKVDGKDIISAGSATAGEVMDGETFYAGSTTLLTGALPTRTLSDASEEVAAGYYAATTLSAVDAHLAVGNIKKDVVVFGFTGTYDPVPTETYERDHVEDLAAGLTYVPGDDGLFSAVLETVKLTVELQDGANAWRDVIFNVFGVSALISDGSHLRFRNADAAAGNIVVMRHHISTGTYERYHTVDLAAGANYVPGDAGLFSHASEGDDIDCEYKYNAAWWRWLEVGSLGNELGTALGIGDGTNLRYLNTDGVNARWLVLMRAIMVT